MYIKRHTWGGNGAKDKEHWDDDRWWNADEVDWSWCDDCPQWIWLMSEEDYNKEYKKTMYILSLARHTLQSEGKRGLVTVHTSYSGDRIWSCPIRFEIWIYCLATLYWWRTRIQSALCCLQLPVTFFCNYCIPTEQLAIRMVTRPSFSWDWRVWLARLVHSMEHTFHVKVMYLPY